MKSRMLSSGPMLAAEYHSPRWLRTWPHFFDDFSGKRQIAGNHQVAGTHALDDFVVGHVEAGANLDAADERRGSGTYSV